MSYVPSICYNSYLDSNFFNDCINSNRLKRCAVQVNKVIDVSISAISLIDNSPDCSSKYPLLEYLSIETSDLKYNTLHVIKLKSIMKENNNVLEDNDIEMDIDRWGGRGKKLN